ncbi:MAG: HAD family acid phosphatase, partial [Bdellovibrionota bacterium]
QEVMNLFSSIERSWKKKFFDGKSLLTYDTLIKNSDAFLNKIYEHDIHIFYLTGRHFNLMRKGTIEQLMKYSFPFKEENLILKKSSFIDDQIFKSEAIKTISDNFEIIGNFENEYLNIAYMSLEAPNAVHVIVDSQHSGRATPELNTPVYRIMGFD